MREGGEVSRFSVENYLSDSAGKFRGWGESFSVSFFPGIDKVWIRGGRQYQGFQSSFFCLTVPRKFVGKPFTVSLLSGAEEVWIGEGGGSIKIFRRNFSVSQCPKF